MRYALDGLRRRPGRSALAGLGIGLATALVVALLALSEGIDASASRLAVASGVDLLATSANTSITGGTFPPVTGAHSVPGAFPAADPNVATASPWLVNDLVYANASLEAASNRSGNASSVPSGWGPTGAGAVGWIPDDTAGLDTPVVLEGPGFDAPGDPHYDGGSYEGPRSGEVVLDESLAAALGVGPGDRVWASPRSIPAPSGLRDWFANATEFRVVGISDPFWLIPSAELAFFYLSELQELDGGGAATHDYASLVLVHLSDPSDPSHDQAVLESAFPALTVLTLANILGAVNGVVNLYRTFGVLVGAIGIAVAALFTATVLLMSVDDRASEIAIRRAIGFPRRAIVRFVVEEALLFSAIGLAIGIPVGVALGWGLDRFLGRLVVGLPEGFSFVAWDASVAAGAIGAVVAIGLLASILPAARAASVPISEELRAP
ncbi:MAG TPA: ABC transporter permease [Thermoplasmata archaeon]|nr:ABC transporter permease [Thermoplasmata archaeon]